MAKATKRFNYKGTHFEAGDTVPADVAKSIPKHFTSGEVKKAPEKVVKKVSTKSRKPRAKTKNGAPKTEDK